MPRERGSGSWWIAGALVACLMVGSAAYLRWFVFDAVVGELTRTREGAISIVLHARRTFPAFPWLPQAELAVSGPRGEWRTSVFDPPHDPAGRIAASATFATRAGALLVRDGGRWRAHELATGTPIPLTRLGPVAGVVPALTVAPHLAAHGIDAATGDERWAIDVPSPCCGMPRVAAFGTTELIVGDRFVDAATGARRPPLSDYVYAADLAHEAVWLDEASPALMRRRAGGPARPVLEVPLAGGVGILGSADDALIVVLHRNAAWSPGVARRERPERVALDELHGRDETVIVALAPDDSLRWALASAGSLDGWCTLESPAALWIQLTLVAGAAFERRAFEIDPDSGEVSDATRGCEGKSR